RIALPGAAGRMGQMIRSVVADQPEFELAALSEHPDNPLIGKKIDNISLRSDPATLGLGTGGVIVDFTRPEATLQHLAIARKTGTAMVIGTTGFTAEQEQVLEQAARDIPLVYCANTSVGVTLLAQLVRQVAQQLGEDWDIEIVETHHNQKVDAPSGTALALGRAAADGRGVVLDKVRDSGRDGMTGVRRSGDIGFAVMRGGDIAGEHTVTFFGQQERIELTHRATSRLIFARGALRAAAFASGQPAGLYSMDDVLG
ncbi:MAG: 4-hydroxy-tetrahydrodipicolinate reductase, partial [Pseudomonadota bacterium]|nr:4-hydroxy-tetrahydrodipicolinate reductase [Pseudomonadota bacterium]